jgi:hypothetical protein
MSSAESNVTLFEALLFLFLVVLTPRLLSRLTHQLLFRELLLCLNALALLTESSLFSLSSHLHFFFFLIEGEQIQR